MTEEAVLAIFGVLMTINIGLIGWMGNSIIGAGKSITAIQAALQQILEDLKQFAEHSSALSRYGEKIAVQNNQIDNIVRDNTLLTERVKILEMRRK